MTKNILFLFLIFLGNNNYATNKIVYMISPPRSLSVDFLRMMEARGDFAVFQEPSQKAYDLLYYPELAQKWFINNTPNTFSEVKTLQDQMAVMQSGMQRMELLLTKLLEERGEL